jgi:4-amino-4-deoxy-L-arabinose transferase-like glycosyltransferase
LLIVALCIGIYLIGTTAVISKDGITFIEYAKNFEISPTKTMIQQYQHPGYPVMILCVHKIARFLSESQSVFSWIYCAQGIALVFRILAIIVLYFLGKELVGARSGFLALLILVLLPKPTHYGSDALSDWPHMFFLASGMLLLIHAAISKKWWLFGSAGLAGGAGYLMRPECVQVIVYGLLWLTLQFFWSKRVMSKSKTALASVLLVIGFCVFTTPYMKLKGAVFPKKKLVQLQPQVVSETTYIADIVPSDIAGTFGQLFENIGETLMWFFVPALFIGLYKAFRKPNWYEPEQFFIIVLVGLNIVLMILLYCKYGYMSVRHTLPLVVFTIFHIPAGLHVLADLLNKKLLKKDNANLGFVILMVIGIVICSPKLVRPLHYDKIIFRKAARWLAENTQDKDLVAVPDLRISFYSGRKGAYYEQQEFPENARYVVRISKREDLSYSKDLLRPVDILYTDESGGKYIIDIYKAFN